MSFYCDKCCCFNEKPEYGMYFENHGMWFCKICIAVLEFRMGPYEKYMFYNMMYNMKNIDKDVILDLFSMRQQCILCSNIYMPIRAICGLFPLCIKCCPMDNKIKFHVNKEYCRKLIKKNQLDKYFQLMEKYFARVIDSKCFIASQR
jgi:hypothetical protein